jgi:hypothetical protein
MNKMELRGRNGRKKRTRPACDLCLLGATGDRGGGKNSKIRTIELLEEVNTNRDQMLGHISASVLPRSVSGDDEFSKFA